MDTKIIIPDDVYSKSQVEQIRASKDLIDEILRENECFYLKDLAVNGNVDGIERWNCKVYR